MEAADISKIVYLGPHETKKIGIVLDAQPRAMMVNTLIAKNIPGEITMPIDQIVKSKDVTGEFTGEEMVPSDNAITDTSEIVVDNEDPDFIISKQSSVNRLKKLLGIQNKKGTSYQQINLVRNIPAYWQPVVQASYYGTFIKSALYTKGGTGDKSLTWYTLIRKPGYYDIYCYVGKTVERMMITGGGGMRQGGGDRGGGGRAGGGGGGQGSRGQGQGGPGGQGQGGRGQMAQPFKEFHYRIYHKGGIENISFDYENAESGWNKLGTYYLSDDTAKVVLSNQSTGRVVIGDAVKWVRQR
jgi:hypothetical protein